MIDVKSMLSAEDAASLMGVRETVHKILAEGVAVVDFEKVDGTTRQMKCTLKNGFIPEDKLPKGTGSVTENTEVMRVFDIEKQEWRSFRVASVKNVAIV